MRLTEGAIAEIDLRQGIVCPAADGQFHRFEDFPNGRNAHIRTACNVDRGGEYPVILTVR